MPITNKEFTNFTGTQSNTWMIWGPAGRGFHVSPTGDYVKVQNDNGTIWPLHLRPVSYDSSGYSGERGVALLDLKSRVPDITKAFAGGSVPSASSWAGEFALITSSGGSYNEGDLLFSTGTSILRIPVPDVCSTITTDIAVNFSSSGLADLEAQCVYAWNNNWWEIRGRSTTDVGLRVIRVESCGTTTKTSNATFLPNDLILKVGVNVKTAYNGGASIAVKIGSVVLASSANLDFSPMYVNLYEKDMTEILSSISSPTAVTVEISGATSGSCDVYVVGGTGEV